MNTDSSGLGALWYCSIVALTGFGYLVLQVLWDEDLPILHNASWDIFLPGAWYEQALEWHNLHLVCWILRLSITHDLPLLCYPVTLLQRFALVASCLCLVRTFLALLDAQASDTTQASELQVNDILAAFGTILMPWVSPHGELEQSLTAFVLAIMALPATASFAAHQLRRIA